MWCCRFSLYDNFLLPLFTLIWSVIVPPHLCSLPSLSPEMTSPFFSLPAPHLLYVRFPYPLHLFSLSIPVPVSYRVFLWGASEGKMVVLALAIGVAEQDDFANIPDLQETAQAAPPANQEPPPEKRYPIMYESTCCMRENGVQMKGYDIEEKQEMVLESR